MSEYKTIFTGSAESDDYEVFIAQSGAVSLSIMPMFSDMVTLRLTDEQAQQLAGGIMKALYTKWGQPNARK